MTWEDAMITMGARLRAARDFKRWTQDELAEYVGVSQPTVQRLERAYYLSVRRRKDGTVSPPRLDLLVRFASALDVQPSWLLAPLDDVTL